MKKIIRSYLFILLAIGMLCTSALASENQSINLRYESGTGEEDMEIISVAANDDTVYLLVFDEREMKMSFEYWQAGMEKSEVLLIGNAYRLDDDQETSLMATNTSKLFSAGKAIYLFDDEDKSVRMLVDANGNLTPNDMIFQIDDMIEGKDGEQIDEYAQRIFTQDGVLYVCKYDRSNNRTSQVCIMYGLETGERIDVIRASDIKGIYPYRDGKLLTLTVDGDADDAQDPSEATPYLLNIFDPVSFESTRIGETKAFGDHNVVYREENNSAYFISGGAVYSFPNMQEPLKLSAYLPMEIWFEWIPASLCGDLFVVVEGQTLYVRELDQPDLQGNVLTVMGEQYSNAHMAYSQKHPDQGIAISALTCADFQQIANALINGDDSLDVIMLDTQVNPITRVIDKGYAADLSGYPEITDIVMQMDPVITDVLMRDGTLYGIPIDVQGSGLGYRTAALKRLGLSPDDLPKTYLEFLAFAANYQMDYEDKADSINLFAEEDVENLLFRELLDNYIAVQARAGEEIRFDTLLFRKLIAAFEAIDFAGFVPHSQNSGENALFTLDTPYWDAEKFSDQAYSVPMILPLDVGVSPLLDLRVTIMFINPHTKRMEQAAEYLASYVQNYLAFESYAFFPDDNEPLINASVAAHIGRLEDDIARIELQLETAEEADKAKLRYDMADAKETIDIVDDGLWSVSEEMIRTYREAATPYFYVSSELAGI
ncbi:MAG: carbohydrate ABC transporter substrate-binding protein [Clostridiales bacterium]|nr:carbohydrate ABC transporter substrate-binding protein [Clostridiales bacterium]